jgi:hypothetical protein
MAAMGQVIGLNSLVNVLKQVAHKESSRDNSVTVGFTQAYAVYVHENLEASHVVGQAKYLEEPARALGASGELARIARKVMVSNGSLRLAILAAGLRLQREAQKLVPVDTGALKASAFTCLTKDVEGVAKAAFDRSEATRRNGVKK